ncbi:MAG: SpoIIE family protein phosphatase, partial [Clostridia bacterium]|nr:SpoIIE family protein phosphatase [Clostridia bacterium]
MKTEIFKYIIYSIIFLLLHYAERIYGIYAFTIPLYFALTFHRQNLIILSPIFIATAIITDFRLWNLLYSATPVIVNAVAMLFHYKLRARPRVLHVTLYTILSAVPEVVLNANDLWSTITLLIGVMLSIPMLYAYINLTYAVVIKKLAFPLTKWETLSAAIFLVVVGLGLQKVNVYWFSLYSLIGILSICMAPFISRRTTLITAVSFGVGGVLGGDLTSLVLMVIYGVAVSGMPREYSYFGGVAGIAGTALLVLTGKVEANYLTLVAPAVSVLIVMLIPTKLKRKISDYFNRESGALTRAVINKNRAETEGKLLMLADSLKEVACALKEDEKEAKVNPQLLAKEVSKKCCGTCPFNESCKRDLGGNSTEVVMVELMVSAVSLGKASILDASPFLSARCRNLHGLIVTANECLNRHLSEIEDGSIVSENKRLLKEQVEGLSGILEGLGREVGKPLVYDTTLERRIVEAFNRKAVSVSEIVAIKDGAISVNVLERDSKSPIIGNTISKITGTKMAIVDKKPSVNGRVTVVMERAPKYRVAYGERLLAREDVSGDKGSVIRISPSKVMLTISDGMGHGDGAGRNAKCAISLIESLYKSGFEHETVLRSVEALLKVRNKEEFNAIDIAVIDTETGEVDFIKQGGRAGYVITPDGLEVIKADSLPLGIVEGGAPTTERRKITTSDFIVLISDGVV